MIIAIRAWVIKYVHIKQWDVITHPCPIFKTALVKPLQWRHNDRDCVSNHQRLDCLLTRLFRRRSKKTPTLRVTGLCVRGIHRWPVNSPHRGPVTRKMFPFDDVIMLHWRLGQGLVTTRPFLFNKRHPWQPNIIHFNQRKDTNGVFCGAHVISMGMN